MSSKDRYHMNLSSFLSGSIFFILVAPQLEREPINYHEVDSVHTFQTLFADAYIAVYNLFYPSQPVLALACFDQDVNPKGALKVFISVTFFCSFCSAWIIFQYPNLYQPGRKSLFFNYGQFTLSALQGFLTSMVLFMIPMGKF